MSHQPHRFRVFRLCFFDLFNREGKPRGVSAVFLEEGEVQALCPTSALILARETFGLLRSHAAVQPVVPLPQEQLL